MSKFNVNKILNRVAKYADNLSGHSARKLKTQSDVLYNAKNLGDKGVPDSTIRRARRLSNIASGRSAQTRFNTALGSGVGVTTGFIGLHKYHQHIDNKIMKKIDNMYKNSYNKENDT